MKGALGTHERPFYENFPLLFRNFIQDIFFLSISLPTSLAYQYFLEHLPGKMLTYIYSLL
jgi:hypothetical protein